MTTTNANGDKDKLDSQTTIHPRHLQTCKRGDLSSTASVARMALPMYHAISRRFSCSGDGSSFAQLRVCMSRVGPMSYTTHDGNHHNPCLQMYISWFPAARLERHAPSAPLSVPTYATEEEPLQFASTTLFDASISRLISRRLPTNTRLGGYATHGKCRSPLGYSKQSWGRGVIREDQPTSTSTPRLQPT